MQSFAWNAPSEWKIIWLKKFFITHLYRVVFELLPDGTAVFSHIGTHDEAY